MQLGKGKLIILRFNGHICYKFTITNLLGRFAALFLVMNLALIVDFHTTIF